MDANGDLVVAWREAIELRLTVDNLLWGGRGIERPEMKRPKMEKGAVSSSLHRACRYVSEGGGKRLRALLVCGVAWDLMNLGCASTDRACLNGAISSAVALELLHAASLVHDDLPALDNDDLRRGRAACHKEFGEATAILTGDALVGAAFMEVTADATISSDNQSRITRIISRAWWDLCIGQQLDIDLKQATDGVVRDQMIRLKTGALFGAAVGCGAVCAGIRESLIDNYIAWGIRVGECFQALDDLVDGDREIADCALIEGECRGVIKDAAILNERLSVGVTSVILGQIFKI
jgi:geranylgeranyl pyrophosphate synthase